MEAVQTLAPTVTPLPTEIPAVADVLSDGVHQISETTNSFVASLPLLATRLGFAALAIVCGWLVLRLGRRLINRFIRRKEQNTGRSYHQRETLRSLITSVFSYLMYFVIITVVLSIFGVNVSSLIAVAGVGGVAIGFGAQSLVKDIISGVFLWSEGNVAVGDRIEVNGLLGTVEGISLRTTTLRDYNGSLYIIPNGDIRTVVNQSRDFKRAQVEVRLNYEDDLEAMLGILRDEMEKSRDAIPGLREAPQVLGVSQMLADAIVVEIAALCDAYAYVDAERALRQRIKRRFDAEGILFPHTPIMASAKKTPPS